MRIKVHLTIGYPTASHQDELEIDDEELEGLSEEKRQRLIDDEVRDWAYNYIEYGWDEA